MKAKQIIKISLLVVVILALVKIGPLTWLFTAGLRTPIQVPAPDYWPTNGWKTSSPEEQGFDSAKLAEGLLTLQENQVGIDSLLIIRNGYIVLDAHFDPYDGKFPHDFASVTKSVTTTLIAIAAEQGKLDLDAPIASFFPDRTIANMDERKARITVRHLTRMVGGLETDCEDDEGTIDRMRSQPDYVQAALDRPMISEPGKEFCYDSPGMHLLSAILQKATGMTAFEFGRQNLFGPLGIENAIWETDPQGYSRGWGDLHLLPEDAAKIGYLWLHRGQWDGKQIVSEAWMLDSVKPHSLFVSSDIAYGNGWWISPADYYATGRGGQRIRVVPTRNTLIVATAADLDYDEINDWLLPLLIDVDGPLPANPQGQAALDAALAAVERGTTDWTANYTPETAAQISGRTYTCESNPAGFESFRMEFDDPGEATLFAKIGGIDTTFIIGVDGTYRMSPEGTGFRGYWKDAQTFYFDVFNIGVVSREVVFNGQDIQVSLPEAALTITCQAQDT